MQPDDKPDDNTLDEVRAQQNSAADLIRSKLTVLYNANEPDAGEEQAEIASLPDKVLSKHQHYMKNLSSSGRSLAEIQTAWHEYYSSLPDTEKHEVWQEFYSEHQRVRQQHADKHANKPTAASPESQPEQATTVPESMPATKRHNKNSRSLIKKSDLRTALDIKQELLSRVQGQAEIRKNPHVRSLAFGLSMGLVTIFILLFSFFNERFVTPFIRPSSNVSATPIIVDPNVSGLVGPEAKIIIPKINVEAPVVYDVPSIEEKDVQKGLEKGVVHYNTTPNPGEKGNAVIFGHSSSNILNKGKYKFAFILLKSLDKNDTFIVQKDGKRYVYKIYNKFVTAPNDLSVLGPNDKVSSITLITCDPPGTSTNRLIVQAEQIFPDPTANGASSVPQSGAAAQPTKLPSNSVSLWQRLTNLF